MVINYKIVYTNASIYKPHTVVAGRSVELVLTILYTVMSGCSHSRGRGPFKESPDKSDLTNSFFSNLCFYSEILENFTYLGLQRFKLNAPYP